MKNSHRQESIKEIQKYYDTFLASEPGKHSSIGEFKSRYEPVLSFFQKMDKKDIKILDIGCGTGMAAGKLRNFGKVFGTDISCKSIEEARRRLDGACVSLGEKPPFKNKVFDVVVCTEVIEHLLDPKGALAEFNIVLKAGGYLIISTPNPWYWQIIRNKIIAALRGQKAGTGQIVENFISPKKLKNMLKKEGFEVEEFTTAFFKPNFIWGTIKRLSNSLGLYQICIARKVCSE